MGVGRESVFTPFRAKLAHDPRLYCKAWIVRSDPGGVSDGKDTTAEARLCCAPSLAFYEMRGTRFL